MNSEYTIEDAHEEIEYLKADIEYLLDSINLVEKWHSRLIMIVFALAVNASVIAIYALWRTI